MNISSLAECQILSLCKKGRISREELTKEFLHRYGSVKRIIELKLTDILWYLK